MNKPAAVWNDAFASVHLKEHTRPNGSMHEQTIITVGTSAGVTVVPFAKFARATLVDVVWTSRPTNGAELPRG